MIKDILTLGNPQLYVTCTEYRKENIKEIESVVTDLHDTMMEYKRVHGAGRAIAAPQIGVQKKTFVYVHRPSCHINQSGSAFPDRRANDCHGRLYVISGLLVRVKRYRECTVDYYDLDWRKQQMHLAGDLSELIQHEYDHLDGILSTMRAIDSKSFFYGDIHDYR